MNFPDNMHLRFLTDGQTSHEDMNSHVNYGGLLLD